MDQFISVMGKEGYALLLDCRDLSTNQIPISQINDYAFLITNSNVPHKLSSSAYCERRDNCYKVAEILNKSSLRDASLKDLKCKKNKYSTKEKVTLFFYFQLHIYISVLQSLHAPDILLKRARHVITEIQRTVDAAAALIKGDMIRFGQLMNESHNSLKNDYEVSSVELDTLVSAAREVNGVLGSRLTGAGFGGCTVTLLKKDVIDETIKHIKAK